VVLATARLDSSRYHVAVEDLAAITRSTSGLGHENVRSDMTLRVLPNGGTVFSVGSITWSSCLSHNVYDNSVARVTWNVLRAFRDDELPPTGP
jgi:N,N-dimethylformamidase